MARRTPPISPVFWMERVREVVAKRAGKRKLSEFVKRVLGRVGAEDGLDLAFDEEARRCLWRLGFISAGDKGKEEAGRFLSEAAREASVPVAEAALLLRLFSSGAFGVVNEPVCGDFPNCSRCPFADVCRYALEGAAGEAPEEESFHRRLRLGTEGVLGAPELLSLVISGGKKEGRALRIARRLLADAGSLRALALKSVGEMERVEGVKPEDAVRVKAALSLGAVWASEPRSPGARFAEAKDFFRYYRPRLRDRPEEYFIVALLNQKNRLIGEVVTGGGGIAGAMVDPRVVLTRALREAAAKVAFIHNHPSGDTEPSPEDIETTAHLVRVCSLAGLKVLDHVIIGGDRFTSMAAEGFI